MTDIELIKELFAKEGRTFSGRYFFDPLMKAMPGNLKLLQINKSSGKKFLNTTFYPNQKGINKFIKGKF